MDWILLPLRRYADFNGRSRRREFWLFALASFLMLCAISLLGDLLGLSEEQSGAVTGLYMLAIFLPSLAVAVRRLHDQDKSGLNLLWYFLPLIGFFIVIYYMCVDGTRGENRFGTDLKYPDADLGDVFS